MCKVSTSYNLQTCELCKAHECILLHYMPCMKSDFSMYMWTNISKQIQLNYIAHGCLTQWEHKEHLMKQHPWIKVAEWSLYTIELWSYWHMYAMHVFKLSLKNSAEWDCTQVFHHNIREWIVVWCTLITFEGFESSELFFNLYYSILGPILSDRVLSACRGLLQC